MVPPEGTLAWGFGDDADAVAQRIMTEQQRAGFNSPAGMMVVGAPLGQFGTTTPSGQSFSCRTVGRSASPQRILKRSAL